jgi:hypothetical protein
MDVKKHANGLRQRVRAAKRLPKAVLKVAVLCHLFITTGKLHICGSCFFL